MAVVAGTFTPTTTPAKVTTMGPTGAVVSVQSGGTGGVVVGGPDLAIAGAKVGLPIPATGAPVSIPGSGVDYAGAGVAAVTDDLWCALLATGTAVLSWVTNF